MAIQKNSEFEREPNIRLTPRYFEAVAYASGLHAGQTRKGTSIPYISHLLGVSALVIEALGDEDQAIAALLHDAAEDCGGEPRLVEIEEMFGPRVAWIVRGCSDSLVEDPTNKLPWEQRKQEYVQHLADADFEVIVVSCADKLHNARALWTDIQREGIGTVSRFNATGRQTAWYYSELLRVFTWREAPEDLLIPLRDVVFDLVRVLETPTRSRLFRGFSSRRMAVESIQGELPLVEAQSSLSSDSGSPPRENVSAKVRLQQLREEVAFNDLWARASLDTAEELHRRLPKTRLEIREYGEDWEVAVYFNVTTPLAVFRSDGSYQSAPDWGMSHWSSVKEGGPDNFASRMISEFGKAQGDQEIERKWSRFGRH